MKRENWHLAVELNLPVLLWGAPGCGKTARVTDYAKRTGRHIEVIIASLREPADICGLPVVKDDGTVVLATPQWAKNLCEKGGVLFIDEITTAPPAVQAALLRVVLDRVVGETKLPDDVRIIAAANPPQQAAGGWDLALPLCNRFIHFDIGVNTDDWMDGFACGWGVSDDTTYKTADYTDLSATMPQARGIIAAFIQRFPTHLSAIPEDLTKRAYPTPRSWDMACKVISACMRDGGDWINDQSASVLAGTVGDGVSSELLGFARNLDIQDPEILLQDPSKIKIDKKRADIVHATLVAVYSAVANKTTVERFQNGMRVLGLVAGAGMMDVCIVAARGLCTIYSTNLTSKKWSKTELEPVFPELRIFSPYIKLVM